MSAYTKKWNMMKQTATGKGVPAEPWVLEPTKGLSKRLAKRV